MNHTFVGSLIEPEKCRQCKRIEIAHSDEAECESCGNKGECEIMEGDILACQECRDRSAEIDAEIAALGNTREERVASVKQGILERNLEVQQSIRVLPDIFNAKMVAIVDLANAIDADATIENKLFRLAQVLDARHTALKETLMHQRKAVAESENEQRAIQQYYNELAKKLRAEEREQIRIKDVTYQIVEPKKISKPKAPAIKEDAPWIEKLETEFPAMKGKVAAAFRAIVVSQECSSEVAYNHYKRMLSPQKD